MANIKQSNRGTEHLYWGHCSRLTAHPLYVFKRGLVLFQFLAGFCELALCGQPLMLLKLLHCSNNQLLHRLHRRWGGGRLCLSFSGSLRRLTTYTFRRCLSSFTKKIGHGFVKTLPVCEAFL